MKQQNSRQEAQTSKQIITYYHAAADGYACAALPINNSFLQEPQGKESAEPYITGGNIFTRYVDTETVP